MSKESKKGSIKIDQERCKGCHLCISVCPVKVITVRGKINQQGYFPAEFLKTGKDGKVCIACCNCATICPDIAIEVYRG